MKNTAKPISLNPLTREKKLWMYGLIVLFIGAVGVGWMMTVGRAIKTGIINSGRDLAQQVSETSKKVTGSADISEGVKQKAAEVKSVFEEKKNDFELVQQASAAKDAIINNMKAEIKNQ